MVDVKNFYDTLKVCGINFFCGVPDSLLKDLCAYITDNTTSTNHIITANEGCAIGLAAGHHLATGNIPLVYMQNSGIGNAINPLLSLADEQVYGIPMLLVIGWRGEPGIHDEPQHKKQGQVTLSLLDSIQMPYIILSDKDEEAIPQLNNMVSNCRKWNKPCAIIVRKNTFSSYKIQTIVPNTYPLSREEALKTVMRQLSESDFIVSTTGKLSRELFEYRESVGNAHDHDFLTVGSMGHSSSIALGIALSQPNKRIWCMDGDGAFLMHMGAITNIGHLAPSNMVHIVFNNGSHESVGAQPTLGFQTDIPAIAAKCGYQHVFSISETEDIESTMKLIQDLTGPIMMELKVGINSRKDLGRPTTSPLENKQSLMLALS